MYCKKCGAQLEDDSKFCDKCGTDLTGVENEQQTANISATTNPESKESVQPIPQPKRRKLKICRMCDTEAMPNRDTCHKCGADLYVEEYEPTKQQPSNSSVVKEPAANLDGYTKWLISTKSKQQLKTFYNLFYFIAILCVVAEPLIIFLNIVADDLYSDYSGSFAQIGMVALAILTPIMIPVFIYLGMKAKKAYRIKDN